MKKFSMAALMVAMSAVSYAQYEAQRTVKASKMIDAQITPQQVIDTLKKRFPGADSVQYYQTSAATAKGWTVSSDDNSNYDDQIQYYTIKFNRQNVVYYALFKADGTLIKSEFQQRDVELPDAVIASLKKLKADSYPDYYMIYKDYFKYENYDTHKEYYQITAVKIHTSIKKIVIVDPTGKIISVN
jgi:IS1 family transposase